MERKGADRKQCRVLETQEASAACPDCDELDYQFNEEDDKSHDPDFTTSSVAHRLTRFDESQ